MIESRQTFKLRGTGEVQGVGKVHPRRVPVECTGHAGGVFDLDVRQPEDVEQAFVDDVARQIVTGGGGKYRGGFKQDGFEDESAVMRQKFGAFCRLARIVLDRITNQDFRINGDHRGLPASLALASSSISSNVSGFPW